MNHSNGFLRLQLHPGSFTFLNHIVGTILNIITMEQIKELKVAAIQLEVIPGDIDRNLRHAEDLVREAAENSAELIVLPEVAFTGYTPNFDLWKDLLIINEKQVRWIKEIALKNKVHLGAGLVEIIEGDVRNTYVIARPDGEIAGRSIKQNAEAYIFKRGNGSFIINTSFGRISVAICADNHYSEVIRVLQNEDIILHLMPHAWPTPDKTGKLINEETIKQSNDDMKSFPGLVSRLLGVPVVFVNQVAKMGGEMKGIFGKFMSNKYFSIQGYSRIVDHQGNIISEVNGTESIMYGIVALKQKGKINLVPDFDGFIHPGPKLLRKLIFPLDIFLGEQLYRGKIRSLRKAGKI